MNRPIKLNSPDLLEFSLGVDWYDRACLINVKRLEKDAISVIFDPLN